MPRCQLGDHVHVSASYCGVTTDVFSRPAKVCRASVAETEEKMLMFLLVDVLFVASARTVVRDAIMEQGIFSPCPLLLSSDACQLWCLVETTPIGALWPS